MKDKVKVIVIDNIGVMLRQSSSFNEYASFIMQILPVLKQLCSKYNITVLALTTQEEKVAYHLSAAAAATAAAATGGNAQETEDLYRLKSPLSSPWHFIPNGLINLETTLAVNLDSEERISYTHYTIFSDSEMVNI